MILKQLAPANTNNTDFWNPQSDGSRGICELVIANVTASAATMRLFGNPKKRTWADEHALLYGHSVPANSTHVFRVDTADYIAVQSGTANSLTFTLRTPAA